MDGERFDQLTRGLAAGISRRRVVGAAAGALAAALGAGRVGAADKKVAICHRTSSATNPYAYVLVSDNPNGPHSNHPGDVFNVDLQTDPNHCGACGRGCDDGDPCTVDTCVNGTCVHAPKDCSAVADACNAGVCQAGTGACVRQPANEGGSCDDGNACTRTDTCQNGACIGGNPVTCTVLSQCHDVGACDPATGACSNPPKPAGAACDDGDACTRLDSCDGSGNCVGGDPVVCTALDACHDVGTCDPGTGLCSDPLKPNGTRCGDDNACNGTETCQDGICTPGTDVVCQPLSQCHDAGVCDAATGLCSNPAKPDGSPCETGNRCTADTCQAGECQEGPVAVTCPLPSPCQQSVACDPATGQCDQIVNRPAGFACGAPASCADGVAHAADACDENGNCVSGADTPCGPGEECDGDGTACVPVACLALQAPCTPGDTPVDNDCCQDETTFCEDVPGCGGETQTQCCHVGNQSCTDACDCCGSDVCEGNRCCHPSGAACDLFEVNACCGQNVCDGGSGRCCRPEGARCSFFEVDDCCPGSECDGSFCRCRAPGEPCTGERDVCCVGLAEGGQCAALDGSFPSDNKVCCLFRGQSCTSDAQCCQSEQAGVDVGCTGGRCCSGPGDGCFRNEHCCSNDCCTEPGCIIGFHGICR